MSDLRDFFEKLVYHNVAQRRFTQQSPVMPDVWIEFGLSPGEAQDLLMVPDWHYTSTDLARELKSSLDEETDGERLAAFRAQPPASGRGTPSRHARVAFNQNAVVATLTLDQLVRSVLPLSHWWRREVALVLGPRDADRLASHLRDPEQLVKTLAALLDEDRVEESDAISRDTVWLARVVGFLALVSSNPLRGELEALRGDTRAQVDLLTACFKGNHERIARALVDLLSGMESVAADDPTPLFSVNRNRETDVAIAASVKSVKADATQLVFDVKGEGIRWAVIDSGIDATHVAFRKRDGNGRPARVAFSKSRAAVRRRRGRAAGPPAVRNQTRVVATYDFINIRALLSASPEGVDELDRDQFPALRDPALRDRLRAVLEDAESHVINWERLEPFLEVRHEPTGARKYRAPVNHHGTHVAGIIAADWRAGDAEPPPVRDAPDMKGVAPAVELYDLRVLDDSGQGNEFAIMSALQFVRDLNNRKDFVAIHGVNLSFSIEHDVANYACGRTPVCEEAQRLVGSGITVVAAAGNSGRARYLTPTGHPDDGFRTVSITDPGNADSVITVGATHRSDPHTYGVSYFSSRGPTGDGRQKPDLVAPGEKILSTTPGNRTERLDGTSMAAPHVSGAVALIMSRHAELIGQPQRIKQILRDTATDLGREKYFQGAGLLDTLRALESI